jgi:3-deoxy-manno-octulosonate cytidylyltransferase (CMP-KDO synthetase)
MQKNEQKIAGIIPSRWGSTRFPGKSLAPIAGKPLVQWVVERASQAVRLDVVAVATDDDRIRKACEAFGARVVMTRDDHPSGTDRVAEAAELLEADVVVNIQGDEPMIDPVLIDRVAGVLCEDDAWDMATAAVPLGSDEALQSPDVVKVVFGEAGRALYFSRAPIPHVRDTEESRELGALIFWRHIGIYGYRRSYLERLVKQPQSLLERAEKLEQLRALHMGARICVIQTEEAGPGVDTPDDIEIAEAALGQAGLTDREPVTGQED